MSLDKKLQEFVDYVWSFYGPGEVYGHFFDNSLTKSEVEAACSIRQASESYGDGDTVDREAVRDMLLSARKNLTSSPAAPEPQPPVLNKKSPYETARSVGKAMNENNDCAVVAVAVACRVTYETAHKALKRVGRKDRKGTRIELTQKAVESLGFSVREVKRRIKQKNGSRYTPRTIGDRLKTGYWLCRVSSHIFAVVNGAVLDHSDGTCRRINNIYRVQKKRGK